MAPFGTIYTYPNNFRVSRAKVVASLNGLDVAVPSDFVVGVTNRSPDFLSKFPFGKVPALECADGFCLAESAAIVTYLALSGPLADQLLGRTDAKLAARITEWNFFAEGELSYNVNAPWCMAVAKVFTPEKTRYERCMTALERALARLEAALKDGDGEFLVGGAITLADIMVFGPLYVGFAHLIDAEMRKDLPSVVRYVKNLAERTEFKEAFGDLVFCEERVRLEG